MYMHSLYLVMFKGWVHIYAFIVNRKWSSIIVRHCRTFMFSLGSLTKEDLFIEAQEKGKNFALIINCSL